MLVLTRRETQSVVINKNIKVIILEIIGSTVKVGIVAPNEVDIIRTELLEISETPVAKV